MILGLRMQYPSHAHFQLWAKEGIFLAQHVFAAFQGSLWYENVDHGALSLFLLQSCCICGLPLMIPRCDFLFLLQRHVGTHCWGGG